MLESVLFLSTGIVFIMIAVAFMGKKVDAVRCFAIAASVFLVMYTIVASGLIMLNMFSVNRSLMLIVGITAIGAAVIVFKNRKSKPSWIFRLKRHMIPFIICAVFAVAGAGVTNDGFFGMDTTIGVSQAKAMNLASKNETSPFEADYLAQVEDGSDRIAAVNTPLQEKYEHYNVPLTALLALGVYFLGYGNMSFIFIVIGMIILYVFWAFLGNVPFSTVRRRRIIKLGAESAAALVMIFISMAMFGRGNDRVKLEWNELKEISNIVSEYDIVVLDEDIMDKYYVPVASVTGAKVYPEYAQIDEVIPAVSDKGERLYYMSSGVMSSDKIDSMGLYLKNVHRNGNDVLYRNLNFYKTHSSVDYNVIKSRIMTGAMAAMAIFALMMFFAGVFRKFDAGLNLLFSTSVFLGMYSVVSWIMIACGIYTIEYAVAVTMAFAFIAWAVMIYTGARMEFTFTARKNIVLIVLCVAVIMIAGSRIDCNLYALYRTLGRSQTWALKYIYGSDIALVAVKQLPWLTALMALFGRLFGVQSMMLVLPAGIAGAASVIFVLAERIAIAFGVSETPGRRNVLTYAVINLTVAVITLVSTAAIVKNMDSKECVAQWKNISSYAEQIEPDDSIAIQRSMYEKYRYPLQIMTGVSTCLSGLEYEDSMTKLGNTGKNTYYLTTEVKDPSFERVRIVAHKDSAFLYETFEYLTDRGIYSVADSVTQGFYDTDLSGMAWTKDQNAFIQCDIPYQKYDTVRLYLGSKIKLDEINLEYIDLEFRENWYYVGKAKINADNNGAYIDFRLNWSYMIDGYNVIYFHSGAMWSPLIYGDKDTRTMGFPFHYIQFLTLGDDAPPLVNEDDTLESPEDEAAVDDSDETDEGVDYTDDTDGSESGQSENTQNGAEY